MAPPREGDSAKQTDAEQRQRRGFRHSSGRRWWVQGQAARQPGDFHAVHCSPAAQGPLVAWKQKSLKTREKAVCCALNREYGAAVAEVKGQCGGARR